MEKQLDSYNIKKELAKDYKVEWETITCIAEIHEKDYGSFYQFIIPAEPDHKHLGVFTNDNDLTSIFEFTESWTNHKIREIQEKIEASE